MRDGSRPSPKSVGWGEAVIFGDTDDAQPFKVTLRDERAARWSI